MDAEYSVAGRVDPSIGGLRIGDGAITVYDPQSDEILLCEPVRNGGDES